MRHNRRRILKELATACPDANQGRKKDRCQDNDNVFGAIHILIIDAYYLYHIDHCEPSLILRPNFWKSGWRIFVLTDDDQSRAYFVDFDELVSTTITLQLFNASTLQPEISHLT